MKTSISFFSWMLAILLLTGVPANSADNLLFSQPVDNKSTFGPSEIWTASGTDSEVADDFNVVGTIERIVANGFIWGVVDFHGVYVRFYQYQADGSPGGLQQEYFLPTGLDLTTGAVDVVLEPPFIATGKHFVSVQPVTNYWYWWSSNTNSPRGQPFFFRNLSTGPTGWHHGDNLNLNVNADVAFFLYGAVTAPGIIEGLSTTSLSRSGLLEIFGSNFGSNGKVLIGGISAPVSYWSSTRIIAYVPETTPLLKVPVQVVTGPGPTNVEWLTVTSRPAADGRVNWRFRMDGPYSLVTPAIGPDGTFYSVDAFFHLYAVAPDGGLKWLVRGAGDKGVAVGSDGTVYTASESDIKAFNADGSEKWTFVQNPRAFICLGVAVGPDGNIYSVGTEGMGVFSLTPQGQLRWSVPELYARRIVDLADIVFGPNGSNQQLYFGANNHTRAVRLDGTPVFTLPGAFQPAIGPDGTVHSPLAAYSPNGVLLWNFLSPYPYNTLSRPDVGPDGIHYFVQNTIHLFALNPGGSQRWHATLPDSYAAPTLAPDNNMLVMGSANMLNRAGSIIAVSSNDGSPLWTVPLPPEDPTVFNPSTGGFGYNQAPNTHAVFSNDGQTVYFLTSIATGDNNTSRSFIYSLATAANGVKPPTPTPSVSPTPTPAPSVPPAPAPSPSATAMPTSTPSATPALTPSPTVSPTLQATGISLSGRVAKRSVTVTGVVSVKDGWGNPVTGVAADATWRLPNGSIQAQTVITDLRGNATFSVKGGRGTFTLTVVNLRKTGYKFDAGQSVLTGSIRK